MTEPLPSRSSRRRAAATVLAVALLVAAAACGGDDGGAASTEGAAGGRSESEAEDDAADPPRGGASESASTASCPEPEGDLARFGSTVVEVVGPDGARSSSCLLVADRNQLRQRGLMEVTDLAGFDGMVFAYATESEGGYWMRNTPMALSIAWIDAEGDVVSTADMEPCLDPGAACPTYSPDGSYRWAIEVPEGDLGAVGLVDGATVDPETLPPGLD